MKITAFIPARMNSVRLPGKALKEIDGLPMVVRVCRAAKDSGVFDAVFAATDSPEIAEACRRHGFDVIMTGSAHETPTSRVAEAASRCESGLYAMIGGDEPLLTGEIIRNFVQQALPVLGDGTDTPSASPEKQPLFAAVSYTHLTLPTKA